MGVVMSDNPLIERSAPKLSLPHKDIIKNVLLARSEQIKEGDKEPMNFDVQTLLKEGPERMFTQHGRDRVKAERINTERPSFPEIYMRMAHEFARRSTCKRLQVGTVITSVDFRKVLAVGYNGNASGLTNTCDREDPGNCGCLHSEENAVINCDASREMPKLVFCTHLPCAMCAKRLINLGNVRTVYYAMDYRKRDAIDLFARAGINISPMKG
jgi:dCMP deaminase